MRAAVLLAALALFAVSTTLSDATSLDNKNRTRGASFRIKLERVPERVQLSAQLQECLTGGANDAYEREPRDRTPHATLYNLVNVPRVPAISPLEEQARDHKRKVCRAALRTFGPTPYMGYVQIGEPAQRFRAMFDTGSDVLWVPHSQCRLNGVNLDSDTRSKFASDKSKSYRRVTRDRLALTYGNGFQFRGWWVTDTVELGGGGGGSGASSLVVPNQWLGLICFIEGSDVFEDHGFDAMVGLSFPSHESGSKDTLLHSLYLNQLLEAPVFSFYVDPRAAGEGREHGGELILGAIDETRYTSPITWVPVVRLPHWDIRVHSVRLLGRKEPRTGPHSPRGVACVHGCTVTVDTGTSTIAGPEADVAALNEQLGLRQHPQMRNIYLAPGSCESRRRRNLALVLTVGTEHLEIGPERYLVDVDMAPGVVVCLSALRSLASLPNGWILGSPFLSEFYMIFDFGAKQVGFARPK